MMKKITAFVLVIGTLFTLLAPSAAAVVSSVSYSVTPDQAGMTEVAPFDFAFLPASPQWLELVAQDEPATLDAEYVLADNVLALEEAQDVAKSIASAGQLLSGSTVQKLKPNKIVAQGGYVPADILDAAAANAGGTIKNGTVVVDEKTGTAFKVVAPTDYSGVYDADESLQNTVKPLEGTYSIAQPQLSEVIKDFNLPEQTVSLTRGNITDFAPGILDCVVKTSQYKLLSTNKDFKYVSDNPLIALKFDDFVFEQELGDGLKLKVTINGGLAIDSMDLTGRYSGFDGYEIAMTVDQECMLNVALNVEIKQEIRIPLYGFDVGFGVGSISGGVFAILGIDGQLRLEIESNTFVSVTQGVGGGTFAYVPTTARPIFDQEIKVDGNVALSGQIDGYIKFGPMVRLELFGFDLVGVGIFLGAGVNVALTLKTLDIELYALFNVYITIVGKTFNLANFKPTIFKRQQADTAGYRVKILEAFVKPGRVGGTIEMEPDDPENEAGYVPAANLPYRILVVPKGVSFDPNHPETADSQADIRKYPADGWAVTNDEGEFIQMDGGIVMNDSGEFIQIEDNASDGEGKFYLNKDDTAYLEFQPVGEPEPYLSDPIKPTLPFSNVTLTKADYFNDFATGQVQPIRVLNWEAKKNDPPEVQYMWAYYRNGIVHVSPKRWDAWGDGDGWSYGGKAICQTDDYGNFDTRWHEIDLGPGLNSLTMLNAIDIMPSDGANEDLDVSLVDHEAVFNKTIPVNPTMELTYSRTVTPVENSHKRTETDGKIIDEIAYDEYLWVINPGGTRTVTEEEFDYSAWGFSTVDATYRTDDTAICNMIAALSGNNKWYTAPNAVLPHGDAVLTPILDENGKETGTALFSQRVTVRWVWQKHPNPVKIISDDHTETTTAGGSFQVDATGFAPFAYSLKAAPKGVVIGGESGIITIPAGLAEQQYTFTIRAEEDRTQKILINMMHPDPYQGNDPSLPDEQTFTLTVSGAAASPSPSPSVEPARTAPVIDAAPHGYELSMTAGSGGMSVPITATGSTPITWSLTQYGARPFPKEISIDPNSGQLTVNKNIAAGTYGFIIKAENDVGFDTQECRLDVIVPRTAAVIAAETHNYVFTKVVGTNDMTVPITATGSTPISWSLEQAGLDYPIPTQVTIDPMTGVLTVEKSIAKGTYYFTICAANDVGSDTQDCTLKVISPGRTTGLSAQPGTAPGPVQLAVSSGSSGPMPNPVIPAPSVSLAMPPNVLMIVNDHALDTYTNDRYTIDGTSYIRWDETMYVTVEGNTITTTIHDNAPVCEKYHYMDPMFIPESVRDAVKNAFKEELTAYQTIVVLPGGDIDTESLLEDIGNFTDMLEGGADTYLEFGSLVDQMKSQSGGKFDVDLNTDTGTMVPGAYFVGLGGNKGASLTFHQDGVAVTFTGKDIATPENPELDLYNFAYKPGALHEKNMLATSGGGGENFTFSFAHHGELPGIATFAVTTDLAEGTQVNVYKFDEVTGGFTTIAKGLTVGTGGVVTYKNDTMSEYLITTQTIAGAEFSDMVGRQGGFTAWNGWLWIGGSLFIIILGVVIWIFLKKRKQSNYPAN